MMTFFRISAVLAFSFALGLPPARGGVIRLEVENPLDRPRAAAPVQLTREQLGVPRGADLTVLGLSVRRDGHDWPRPFQLDDRDQDGQWDEVFFQLPIAPRATLSLTLTSGQAAGPARPVKKRVDAVIDRSPSQSGGVTKPAWESELMGYCLYGAAQTDCLGKIQPRLTLDWFFGKAPHPQHEFTMEHGQDFLDVKNTMGAHAIFVRDGEGAIQRPWTMNTYGIKDPLARLDRQARYDFKVLASGPLRTLVRVRITDWKTKTQDDECEILYSMASLQRHTEVAVRWTHRPKEDASCRLGAGFKQMFEDVVFEVSDAGMSAIAENVLEHGIVDRYVARAILLPRGARAEAIRIPNDPGLKPLPANGPNYGLVFPKGETAVRYAFVAAWEKDGGITSPRQWKEYLGQLSAELDSPLVVKVLR